ncbi:MAG: type II toxin-antitoxin system VapB family antitoxin [Acidobacteriota bacterium]|jgi:hypothetical protein
MSLNIKNERTDQLIRELASLRGVSLVTAVTQAVEETIEREKEGQSKKKLMADWLMAISRETGPMMEDGKTSTELIEEIYDPQTGLPR